FEDDVHFLRPKSLDAEPGSHYGREFRRVPAVLRSVRFGGSLRFACLLSGQRESGSGGFRSDRDREFGGNRSGGQSAVHYTINIPPLISMVWPWMYRAAWEHRNRMVSAISSLVPSFPAGVAETTASNI